MKKRKLGDMGFTNSEALEAVLSPPGEPRACGQATARNKQDKSCLGVYLLPKMRMSGFETSSKEAKTNPHVFLLRQPE